MLSLGMAISITACDLTTDTAMASARNGAFEGPSLRPWPPPGGTLNTAWLGNVPLMRLLPPNYPPATHRSGDRRIDDIEVFDGVFRQVTAVTAVGGRVVMTTSEGQFEGDQLIGSRWWLDPARTNYVTITQYGEDQNHHGYQLEHRQADEENSSVAVCEPDIDGDHWAYIVGDVLVQSNDAKMLIDPKALLVACASGALGKAITWGFTPWELTGGKQLDLYQTGVRTIMADYCGNGFSYTEDGTEIQVHSVGAGLDFTDASIATEALFGPNGALCLTTPRLGEIGPSCGIPACPTEPELEKIVASGGLAWTKLGDPNLLPPS